MEAETLATDSEVVTTEPEQATEATAPSAETSEQATDTPDKPKEHELPKGVQRRIDRITRAKYEAEARNKMLEERIQALEQTSKPSQPQGAPKIEDFQDFDQYLNARDEFLAKKMKSETIAEYEKRQQAESAQRERQKTLDTYQKRVAQAVKELPDFDDVVYRPDVTISDVMAHTIMESDAGPKVAYYLGTHPDEAERIADLSPVAAIKELTRIEDKLSKTKATNTPPPTNPVGSRAKAEKDPSDMSLPEFIKYREAYVRKHR